MSRRAWEQHLAGMSEPSPPTAARRRHEPASRPARDPVRKTAKRHRSKTPTLTAEHIAALDAQVPAVQARCIQLIGKPRMTQRDRWKKRPCVLRYRAMCDELRLSGLKLPSRFVLIAFMAMPTSWPAAQKRACNGQPHLSKPDQDNISKGCQDALSPSDSHHWDGRCIKLWAYSPKCVIVKAPVEESTVQALIAEHLPAEAD